MSDDDYPLPPRRRSLDVDPTAPITKTDLWDVRDMIGGTMAAGFKGVHERQDKTNGRVNSAHEELSAHAAEIENLKRKVFAPARRLKKDDEPDRATFTMRDVKMIGFGGGAVIGFVTFLWKVLPAILKALA